MTSKSYVLYGLEKGRELDMDAFKEAIQSGLEEYLQSLERAIDGLTPAEARWQPMLHTNHIAWLVWHMVRGDCHPKPPYSRTTCRHKAGLTEAPPCTEWCF